MRRQVQIRRSIVDNVRSRHILCGVGRRMNNPRHVKNLAVDTELGEDPFDARCTRHRVLLNYPQILQGQWQESALQRSLFDE